MASYGISILSIIPGRKEPSDAAEQVTQILFGEHYEVKETGQKWIRIKTLLDKYECWIDKKQHHAIDEKFVGRLNKQEFIPVSLEMASWVQQVSNNTIIPIVLGSSLPFLENGEFKIGKVFYKYEGQHQLVAEKKNNDALVQQALVYLNTPYLWGGRHPFGIDCSAFVQICYKTIGINLPRDAYQQAALGRSLSFIEESEPGDLAFFANKEGNIIHVGILLKDNCIIHASGKVRIDRIDNQGIYNNDVHDYSYRLRIIKRIID